VIIGTADGPVQEAVVPPSRRRYLLGGPRGRSGWSAAEDRAEPREHHAAWRLDLHAAERRLFPPGRWRQLRRGSQALVGEADRTRHPQPRAGGPALPAGRGARTARAGRHGHRRPLGRPPARHLRPGAPCRAAADRAGDGGHRPRQHHRRGADPPALRSRRRGLPRPRRRHGARLRAGPLVGPRPAGWNWSTARPRRCPVCGWFPCTGTRPACRSSSSDPTAGRWSSWPI